jgi:hypothetical protein
LSRNVKAFRMNLNLPAGYLPPGTVMDAGPCRRRREDQMQAPDREELPWTDIEPYFDRALQLDTPSCATWLGELDERRPDIAQAVRTLLTQRDFWRDRRSRVSKTSRRRCATSLPGTRRA